MINKSKFLKFVLRLGVIYYIIGAIVHYFGITLFPFYDKALYMPYHDSVIALSAIIFAMILYTVAKDPVKNIDMLKVVIIGAIIASFVSIVIVWKVDFTALGAPAKKTQTIVEGVMNFIWVGALLWSYPKGTN